MIYRPLTQHWELNHLTACGWVIQAHVAVCATHAACYFWKQNDWKIWKLTSNPAETFIPVAEIWLHNECQEQDDELRSAPLPILSCIPLWVFWCVFLGHFSAFLHRSILGHLKLTWNGPVETDLKCWSILCRTAHLDQAYSNRWEMVQKFGPYLKHTCGIWTWTQHT